MEESNFLLDSDAALEPLLQAVKDSASSNISTVQALVQKILSDPDIFCGFDQVKAVLQQPISSSADGPSVLKTLDLFSYGRYNDYVNPAEPDVKYLSLNQAQTSKLHQLTVMSLVQDACSNGQTVISYEFLATQLGLARLESDKGDEELWRQVEQIAISCVYSSLLQARLCQKTKSIIIITDQGPPCLSRDVRMEDISGMIQTLRTLDQRLETATSDLDSSSSTVQKILDINTKNFQNVENKKASMAHASFGHSGQMMGPGRLMGGGGGGGGWIDADTDDFGEMGYENRGFSDASRRNSTRRQSKRSRGGRNAAHMEPGSTNRY